MRIFGILFLALAAGCAAGVKETSTSVTAQTWPLMVHPSLIGPGPYGTKDEAVAVATPLRTQAVEKEAEKTAIAPELPATAPRESVMAWYKSIGTEPVAGAPAATAPPSTSPGAPRTAVPPAKVSAAPAAIAPPRKSEEPLPAARKPEPPLDVATLKARLRDTDAIGVFTKLALGNQVDDLLKLFRQHHQSGNQAGVASLREPYNLLVLKVLVLVQDSDPALARTISASREAIWSLLADREKFNSVS
jgi:hypothetical protein